MITCAEARDRMLEADLDELAATAATELGAHLLACDACRAAAETIRTAERGLGERLAAARPRGDDAEAVARAVTIARRRRLVRRSAGGVALAAAAAVAALLLLPRGRIPTAPPPSAYPVAATGFSVAAAPGRDVMVVHPADSNIVVVWFFPSRRSS